MSKRRLRPKKSDAPASWSVEQALCWIEAGTELTAPAAGRRGAKQTALDDFLDAACRDRIRSFGSVDGDPPRDLTHKDWMGISFAPRWEKRMGAYRLGSRGTYVANPRFTAVLPARALNDLSEPSTTQVSAGVGQPSEQGYHRTVRNVRILKDDVVAAFPLPGLAPTAKRYPLDAGNNSFQVLKTLVVGWINQGMPRLSFDQIKKMLGTPDARKVINLSDLSDRAIRRAIDAAVDEAKPSPDSGWGRRGPLSNSAMR